jgi:anti-sigma-K factor RskA
MDKRTLDDAVLYILGELPEEQTQAFEDRIDAESELAEYVRNLALAHESVALTARETTPPANIPDKVLARAKKQATADKRIIEATASYHWRSPAWVAAAALALCAALFSVLLLQESNQRVERLRQQIATLEEAPTSLESFRIVTFAPQEKQFESAQTVALWDTQTEAAYLIAGDLPQLGEGEIYQVWALDERQKAPIPGDTFGSNESFLAFGNLQSRSPKHPTSLRFAVSIEPAGGSLSPTGPIVLVSNLVPGRS